MSCQSHNIIGEARIMVDKWIDTNATPEVIEKETREWLERCFCKHDGWKVENGTTVCSKCNKLYSEVYDKPNEKN